MTTTTTTVTREQALQTLTATCEDVLRHGSLSGLPWADQLSPSSSVGQAAIVFAGTPEQDVCVDFGSADLGEGDRDFVGTVDLAEPLAGRMAAFLRRIAA